MINSHWVCPSGCLSVYMNFFKRLRIWREDRHRAPQAFNTPPLCIFSHPRTTVFRGSGRIKARIDRNRRSSPPFFPSHPIPSHPIASLPFPSLPPASLVPSHMLTLAHTHTCKFMMRVSILMCVCVLHENAHRLLPTSIPCRVVRQTSILKKKNNKISPPRYNGVFKNRIIH